MDIDFNDSTGGPFCYSNLTHLIEIYDSDGTVGTMICTDRMPKVILPYILTGEKKTVDFGFAGRLKLFAFCKIYLQYHAVSCIILLGKQSND